MIVLMANRSMGVSKCAREYWGSQDTASRKNIEFFLGLRNKIEHSYYAELDPALYGECQAMLMNFEDVLVREFGLRPWLC